MQLQTIKSSNKLLQTHGPQRKPCPKFAPNSTLCEARDKVTFERYGQNTAKLANFYKKDQLFNLNVLTITFNLS